MDNDIDYTGTNYIIYFRVDDDNTCDDTKIIIILVPLPVSRWI